MSPCSCVDGIYNEQGEHSEPCETSKVKRFVKIGLLAKPHYLRCLTGF